MRRVLCSILIITLVISIIGCANNKKEATETGKDKAKNVQGSKETEQKQPSKADKKLKPMTISIGHWESSFLTKGGDSDTVLKLIEDKFNVKFEGKSVSWSDFAEKYKLWAASDELPDIFATNEINSESYETWINQGIIKPLPDDMSKYPKIASIFELPDVKPLKKDGKFYMIPRKTYTSYDMWVMDKNAIIRKDWLKKLNLEMPKTFEELKVVVKKMVNADLDGNNTKDTIGITHKALFALETFFMDCAPAVVARSWVKEDGKWIPPYMSEDVLKGIKKLRDLYTEGLLDKDFAILKTNDGIEKFCQGNTAVLATQAVSGHLKAIKKSWEKYNNGIAFEDAVGIIPIFPHEDGKKYAYNSPIYWSETYFNGNMSDEKMERILSFLEYTATDEFREIKLYGIEGVDYKKSGDKYEILLGEDEQLDERYPSLKVFTPFLAWGQEQDLTRDQVSYKRHGKIITDMSIDYYEKAKKEMTSYPINFDIRLMVTPAKTKLKSIKYLQDVTKVVLKDGPVEEEWNKIIDGYKALGVEQAIKEVNEKYKK